MKIFDHGIGFFLIYAAVIGAAIWGHGGIGETPKNSPQSAIEVTRTV